MNVPTNVLLALFRLVNESSVPELADIAVSRLTDEELAGVLEVFDAACRLAGMETSALVRQAAVRLADKANKRVIVRGLPTPTVDLSGLFGKRETDA